MQWDWNFPPVYFCALKKQDHGNCYDSWTLKEGWSAKVRKLLLLPEPKSRIECLVGTWIRHLGLSVCISDMLRNLLHWRSRPPWIRWWIWKVVFLPDLWWTILLYWPTDSQWVKNRMWKQTCVWVTWLLFFLQLTSFWSIFFSCWFSWRIWRLAWCCCME